MLFGATFFVAFTLSADAFGQGNAIASGALADVFEQHGVEATIVVTSLDGTALHVHNKARSSVRFSPASTFKIPNTLIALDGGFVTAKDSVFTWDGADKGLEQWNTDQTLESAFKVSCVWCYQEIARKVGAATYIKALQQIEYGNENVGEQVDSFWLNGDLGISAVEQIAFLRQLRLGRLPYLREHLDTLEEIMLVEQNADYSLYAKTGWTGAALAVGWYVGYVKTANGVYLFAMNMYMDKPEQAPLRRLLTIQALQALNII